MTARAAGGPLRRFVGLNVDPSRSEVLAPDHAAVVQRRTLFRANVKPVEGSRRFLISGHNNAKIGKAVTRGEWAGLPIFTLTLEERATCPASCAQWRACYGNATHWPTRWDAADPDFIDTLRAEIITTCRAHPDGIVVRLHVLGDFFSTAYVAMWAEMLRRFPGLRAYGYTAREGDEIAAAVEALTHEAQGRFAIRLSRRAAGPGHAIVVDEPVSAPDVIMCPAQTHATETCGTCGLCWAPAARGKTIAFLRHGIVRRGAAERPAPASRAPRALSGRRGRRPLGALPGETKAERDARVRAYRAANPGKPTWAVADALHMSVAVVAAAGGAPLQPPPATSAAERLAAVPADERERIARQYGAMFRGGEARSA